MRDGWKLKTTVSNAEIDRNSSKVHIELDSEWSDIGNGWRVKPDHNPEVSAHYYATNKICERKHHSFKVSSIMT